ncbi:ArdC-like ssDNA-binding domain-containing protein [Nocardioides pakistanensis]
MTTSTFQPRQPKGLPAGGQFSTKAHGESEVALDAPTEPQSSRTYADTQGEVFTQKYDSVEEKVAAYKAELDQAVADLDQDENWLNYVDTMSKFHRYSPTNQMLIWLQTGGKATRVAGFRKWQNDFNRTVKKGEKAIGILAPRVINVTERDANGKPKKDADGKPVKRRQVVGFTTASVFDVAQTEGDPLPEIDVELAETPPDGFVDDMVAAANRAGYEVEFRQMDSHANGTAQGWTSPREKKIVIDASLTSGSQAATLAHELGHVHAGHVDGDLGDYHTGPGGCRGRYEVEAESVAYALGRSQGMKMDGAKLSAQYVAGWSRHDKEALRESADTVSKAVKKILTDNDFRNTVED